MCDCLGKKDLVKKKKSIHSCYLKLFIHSVTEKNLQFRNGSLTLTFPASWAMPCTPLLHFPSLGFHQIISIFSLKKPPYTPTPEKWRVKVSVTQFRNLHFWNPLPITWHQLLYRPLAGPLDTLLPASTAPPAHMATAMLSQHSAPHPEWKPLHALTRPWGFTWSGLGPFLCLTLHCSPPFCPDTLAFSQSPHSGCVINNLYTHGPLPVMLIFFSIIWIHPSDHKTVSLPLRRMSFDLVWLRYPSW